MLKSIDLFSGIGGLTLALHDVASPVLYCDHASDSQAVLQNLMRRDRLPRAPICSDVKDVTRSWVKKHCAGTERADLIVAGFPCTSISKMGLQKGFRELDKSGLFYEVLRIADELKTPMVFLENVMNILRLEMNTVVHEIAKKRGYRVMWCINSASNMGAAHERKRWFCLAVKQGYKMPQLPFKNQRSFNWNERLEPERTTTTIRKGEAYSRIGLLGNSVVPDAVRYAFRFLYEGLSSPNLDKVEVMREFTTTSDYDQWPKCVYVDPQRAIAKTALELKFRLPNIPEEHKYRKTLVFDPKSYVHKGPMSTKLKQDQLLYEPVVRTTWVTSRHNIVRPCNFLTVRSSHDLPTQVRFERSTTNRTYPINPIWLEFLFGYPSDWTKPISDRQRQNF